MTGWWLSGIFPAKWQCKKEHGKACTNFKHFLEVTHITSAYMLLLIAILMATPGFDRDGKYYPPTG